MRTVRLPRLYPILDLDTLATRGLSPLAVLDAWLGAGITVWQLRAKHAPSGALLALLDAAVARTGQVGGQLIVNDRADLALAAGAGGVHLGQADLSPADVRAFAPPPFLVGRSTHTDPQVEAACAEPIDYLAIGPVYATASKPGAVDPVVGLSAVGRAASRARSRGLPVVAIGGITLTRAPEVFAAGADAVAVISDLLVGDPALRVRQFHEVLVSLPL